MRSLRVAHLLLVAAGSVTAATNPDTEKLAAHLRSLRGHAQLPVEEYRSLRREYLAWIDVRVRANWTAENFNQELKNNGLLFEWQGTQPMFENHAGWVDPVKEHLVRDADDLFVVEAMIDQGVCTEDGTALLYDKKSFRKVAEISAGGGSDRHGYDLLSIDAGAPDFKGRRVVASRWVASSCAGNWNGEFIRIDSLKQTAARNLLFRTLDAATFEEHEDLSVEVQRNIATFRFDGGIRNADLLATPTIARYRVDGDRAIRLGPIALTRAGFIQEWLTMTDANPSDWADPQAVQQRPAVAAELNGFFEWGRIANCGAGVWDIAVTMTETHTQHVFKIRGNRATGLRMLSISDAPDESCHIEDDITAVSEVLLW